MNFDKRLSAYIRNWLAVNHLCDDFRYRIKQSILRQEIYGNPRAGPFTEKEVDLIDQVSGWLNREIITETWLKMNDHPIMKCYYEFIAFNEEHGFKNFTLLPLCAIKVHAVKIDKKVLYALLKAINGTEATSPDNFNAEFEFGRYFDTTGMKNHEWTWTKSLHTDGITASFLFERIRLVTTEVKKPKKQKVEQPKFVDATSFIGIDPGRANLITAIKQDEHGHHSTIKLTRKQFYNDAGITKTNQRVAHWNKRIVEEELLFAQHSLKTVDLDQWRGFLFDYIQVHDALWDEKCKPQRSRARFRMFNGKKRVMDKTINKFKNEDKTMPVIGYGAAKFSATGKGEAAVPWVLKHVERRCPRVMMIDEFRTSQTHHECLSRYAHTFSNNQVAQGGLAKQNGERSMLVPNLPYVSRP
jgi:hypothetical protein